MEELIAMAKKFKEAIGRGEGLGLNTDELAFYDALANNEEAVREMGDDVLKKIAHELAENLRKNLTVDWSVRESVRASLRLDGEADPAQIQVPARWAGRGSADGPRAGGDAYCCVGVKGGADR